MRTQPTTRLYLHDDHCFEADAIVLALDECAIACDQTCFYPGGGGQPCDKGAIRLRNGALLEIESVRADTDGVIWHVSKFTSYGSKPP